MAKTLHKLAALRLLSETMRSLEIQHKKQIAEGDDPASVDRDIAEAGLASVVGFFLDHGIESRPLSRLLRELAALSAGASPSQMLSPAKTRHRRPNSPVNENIKGRLAAIMEYQQCAGLHRRKAAEWVVRSIPSRMRQRLGAKSPATVDSWLVKWGGKRGPSSNGRDGYLLMRAILTDKKPVGPKLENIIKALGKLLPS